MVFMMGNLGFLQHCTFKANLFCVFLGIGTFTLMQISGEEAAKEASLRSVKKS